MDTASDTSPVFGIDLGTTNTCVAVALGKGKPVVCNFAGNYTLPSVVTFKQNCFYVGHAAVEQEDIRDPQQTIKCVKRLMGRTCADIEENGEEKLIAYKYSDGKDGKVNIHFRYRNRERTMQPEFISAMILHHVRSQINKYHEVKNDRPRVVITVPAYFNQKQRYATRVAGRIAGLDVLRVLNEPTAGAFAYELHYGEPDNQRHVLIYDFGGGTFDVTILSVFGKALEVKATNGSASLGGEDVDVAIQEHILSIIEDDVTEKKSAEKASKFVDKIRGNVTAMQKIREEGKRGKEMLSNCETVAIRISRLVEDYDLDMQLTAAMLSSLVSDIIDDTKEYVDACLESASLKSEDIHRVVLLGGSTNLRDVHSFLFSKFGKDKIHMSLNADHAVALGAAACAYTAAGISENEDLTEYTLLDIVPRSLGVAVREDGMDKVAPFIMKGMKVPVNIAKPLYPSTWDQTAALFSVREGEDFENGNKNPEIAQILLDGELFKNSAFTCELSLDRDYVLSVSAWSDDVKESLGSDAERSTTVPLTMSGMAMGTIAFNIKALKMFDFMNQVELGLIRLSGDSETIKMHCALLDNVPSAFLAEIEDHVKNTRVIDEKRLTNEQFRENLLLKSCKYEELSKAALTLTKSLSKVAGIAKASSLSEEHQSAFDDLRGFISAMLERKDELSIKATRADELFRAVKKKRKRS